MCNHNGAAKTEGSVPTRKKGTKQKILKINYQRDGRENVRHKKKVGIFFNDDCVKLCVRAAVFRRYLIFEETEISPCDGRLGST